MVYQDITVTKVSYKTNKKDSLILTAKEDTVRSEIETQSTRNSLNTYNSGRQFRSEIERQSNHVFTKSTRKA